MKKILILIEILILIVLVLLVGCNINPSPVEEYCEVCSQMQLAEDRILDKTCECVNHNNLSYTIDFNCGESTGICEGLTFETKKKLALVDDHWYCVCQERAVVTRCKQIDGCSTEVYSEETNRTTEFVWRY